MESHLEYHAALALLDWQVELGVTEAICDAPVDRYALADKPPRPKADRASPVGAPAVMTARDPVADARALAAAATTLDDLRTALAGFEHCELKKGARNLVFADGTPGARVMIIGEAPGRDEDQAGRPFVGKAGLMLDKMLAAIGLERASSVYITNVVPWRPPQNREPKPDEIAMMVPFLTRHVQLARPDVLVLMGNISCQAGLGTRGILRLRGNWAEAYGKPALPMTHPAYLLRTPSAKREAWADLLALNAWLRRGA